MYSVAEISEINLTVLSKAQRSEDYFLHEKATLAYQLQQLNNLLTEPLTVEIVLKAAASCAYNLAAIQAFRDGNRRTALLATKGILDKYSLGYLLKIENDNDHQIVRMLNNLVDKRTISEQDFYNLFVRRYLQRTPPPQKNLTSK